jgi:arsenite methyltransferase
MNVKTNSSQENIEGLGLDIVELRQSIQKEYQEVARSPDKGFHFHTGRRLTKIVGYEPESLDGVPETAIASFAGTGNPFAIGPIHSGEHVVDIGCGAGIDTFIAAKKVGPSGRVIGVDMTEAMLERASIAKKESGSTNIEFKFGFMEELPIAGGWADVIISNGVFNLAPDKSKVLREMARVLKPDGRLQIADILVQREVPLSAKRKIDLWTGWIAGALLEEELDALVTSNGFIDFQITWRDDVFKGAPQAGSAANFGTLGINFKARKT